MRNSFRIVIENLKQVTYLGALRVDVRITLKFNLTDAKTGTGSMCHRTATTESSSKNCDESSDTKKRQ
jgi:hypothetical protein